MSEFHVEVVRIGKVEKHPNADTLSITNVHGGYPCIFRTGDFKEGDLAVYVPVDAIVPTTDERFAFLGKHDRIKAKRLRGIFSMGLLVAADRDMREGENVAERLGITKWEPEIEAAERRAGKTGTVATWGESEPDHSGLPLYTDLEGMRRWGGVIEHGEPVVLVEKIHGANARFVHDGKRLWVGSRTQMKRDPHRDPRPLWARLLAPLATLVMTLFPATRRHLWTFRRPPVRESIWWQAARLYELETKLATMPGVAVFGEVYGNVQDLKYGVDDGVRLALFDAMDVSARRWLDFDEFVSVARALGLPIAPVLYRGPWTDELLPLAQGPSTMPGATHMREGFVVRPVRERMHPGLGRVVLKQVGEDYLLRKAA